MNGRMDRTQRLIRAVQACRRKVAGLDDDAAWRDLLERVAGKRSLREMTGPELARVLDALHQAGAPRAAPRLGVRRLADDAQSRMIRGLWIELHELGAVDDPSETAIASFVKRQTGCEALQWLNTKEANAVIEALKSWVLRVQAQIQRDSGKGKRELRDECRTLWEQLRGLGAVTFDFADVEVYGYRHTGKAAFVFYERDDFIRLRDKLARWAADARRRGRKLSA